MEDMDIKNMAKETPTIRLRYRITNTRGMKSVKQIDFK